MRPDERFTLASERTFLAWMRTALGLMVAGIAIIHVVPDFSTQTFRSIIGFAFVALACVAAVEGLRRWRQVSNALATGSDMPGPRALTVITIGVTVVGVGTLLAIAIDFAT
ncbi:DUF202 domain-containing protein [Hoyosella sp. YIM 151337]|uniref:YidH family protein n=1 Tax=Hoyosella sp. YIM 151337 TaxID=2992742 RepID=UPI002235C5FA|nr:DUF202 domain-containing protein [Hoyosella sp. YIM 151337]MCW4354397.1 DUF202 domain-containing protein [Hoyosella sp. YIM 151337]